MNPDEEALVKELQRELSLYNWQPEREASREQAQARLQRLVTIPNKIWAGADRKKGRRQ